MKKLFDLLSVKQNIVITTHVNPDGDAIGSSLALYNFLIKYDHNVNVIVPNPYPDFEWEIKEINKSVSLKQISKCSGLTIKELKFYFIKVF